MPCRWDHRRVRNERAAGPLDEWAGFIDAARPALAGLAFEIR
jgi:hypothetical protein